MANTFLLNNDLTDHDNSIFLRSNKTYFQVELKSILFVESTGNYFKNGIMVQEWNQVGGKMQQINMIIPDITRNETLLLLHNFESIWQISESKAEYIGAEMLHISGGNEHFSESNTVVTYWQPWTNLLIMRDWE